MGCAAIYLILIFLILLPFLFAQLITGAFMILGFSPEVAVFLLIAVILGGLINIPVKKWEPAPRKIHNSGPFSFLQRVIKPRPRILAVNVGGAIVPGLVSIWQIYRIYTEFIYRNPGLVVVFPMILAMNIFISYKIARPVEGKGIVMPAFIPPVFVAFASIMFYPAIAPVIAFPAGVLGVLIGADLMHLKDIKNLNAPIGSIGGAGTFDGIFLCGVFSVLLSAI